MTQSSFSKHVQRFLQDDRGTNAIEFALTFPFLIALLLFVTSANDSVNASTEIGKVTVAVADILSQSPTINRNTIDATFDAADLLVAAGRTARLEMFVAGIEVKADETAEVIWSRSNGNLTSINQPAPGDTYNLPPEILVRPGFIVTARARLTHTNILKRTSIGGGEMQSVGEVSLLTKVIGGDSTYDYESNFVPRSSIETSCSDCSN